MRMSIEWVTRGLDPFELRMARHAARKWIDKLGRYPRAPVSCAIAIERSPGPRLKASPVSVRVEVRLPDDARLVAARHVEEGEANEHVGPAVEQAFQRLHRLAIGTCLHLVDAELVHGEGARGPLPVVLAKP